MLCSQCGSSAWTMVSGHISDRDRGIKRYIGSKMGPFKENIGASEDGTYIYMSIYIYTPT